MDFVIQINNISEQGFDHSTVIFRGRSSTTKLENDNEQSKIYLKRYIWWQKKKFCSKHFCSPGLKHSPLLVHYKNNWKTQLERDDRLTAKQAVFPGITNWMWPDTAFSLTPDSIQGWFNSLHAWWKSTKSIEVGMFYQ